MSEQKLRVLHEHSGQELRVYRESYGFSCDEVAVVLGVSPAAVRRIEQAEIVDQVTWEKYERSVGYLRGLLRGMARRLTRAMRQELEPV